MRTIVAGLMLVMAMHSGVLRAETQKPNVVMIVLDDLNDYLGVMSGHPQAITPHMDRLANTGVLFGNAHSSAPVCAPSRSSFMSGIHPATSQNYGFEKWESNPTLKHCKTLSAYAMENGYKAYQTGKIQHHSKASDWHEMGVKKYQGPMPYDGKSKTAVHPSVPAAFSAVGPLDGTFAPLSDVPAVPASKSAPGYTGWWHFGEDRPFRYVNDEDRDLMTDERSAEWFEQKIQTLEKSPDDSPFFIAFGIMNPHTPHVVPKKYYDMYPLDTLELPVIKKGDNDDCSYDEVLSGKGRSHFAAIKQSYPTVEEGIRAYLQGYLACVTFADDIVGRVVEAVEESGFADDTIIILFSDHGYNIGEKDYLFKNSPWEESTRVPFIIRDPRYAQNAGKVVDHPISLIDVYPTVKDLCGMTGPTVYNDNGAQLDGHSLKPFLENPESATWNGPDVALTVIANSETFDVQKQNYSIRSKNYRYVRYSNGSEELYDLTKDAYEWNNLINHPEYAAVKKQMRRQLDAAIPETKNPRVKPVSTTKSSAVKPKAQGEMKPWKVKYLKDHPESDANGDGILTWDEIQTHKKQAGK